MKRDYGTLPHKDPEYEIICMRIRDTEDTPLNRISYNLFINLTEAMEYVSSFSYDRVLKKLKIFMQTERNNT